MNGGEARINDSIDPNKEWIANSRPRYRVTPAGISPKMINLWLLVLNLLKLPYGYCNGDKRRAWQITKLLRLWNIELQEELSYQLIQNFRAQLRPYSIEIQRGSPKRYWAVRSLLRSYHIVGQAYRQLRVNYHHWTK